MKTDGTDIKKLTHNPSNDYEPIFSLDGLSIIFTSERDGNKEIYIMDNEGKNLTNLSNRNNRGSISGFSWGLGFLGGLLALFVVFFMFFLAYFLLYLSSCLFSYSI